MKKHLLESFNVQTFESNNFMNKWNSGNKEAAQKLDGKDARQFVFGVLCKKTKQIFHFLTFEYLTINFIDNFHIITM